MVALLFASGILALSTTQNVFFLLFSLLLGSSLISSFVNRLMLAGLVVKLELPEHPVAGEEAECRLIAEHRAADPDSGGHGGVVCLDLSQPAALADTVGAGQ